MQLWQYYLLVTAKLLYMFRTLSASIISNRPRISLLDIYDPDPWHEPVAASTGFSTPDDGRRKRPKHVE